MVNEYVFQVFIFINKNDRLLTPCIRYCITFFLYFLYYSIHPPPAFGGLSPDLEFALDANKLYVQEWDSTMNTKHLCFR